MESRLAKARTTSRTLAECIGQAGEPRGKYAQIAQKSSVARVAARNIRSLPLRVAGLHDDPLRLVRARATISLIRHGFLKKSGGLGRLR
jgi:hypothetical protein